MHTNYYSLLLQGKRINLFLSQGHAQRYNLVSQILKVTVSLHALKKKILL